MIQITEHQSPSLATADQAHEFWTELAIMEFSRGVRRMLRRKGLTQKELATQLGFSEPYISKVLSSAENLTINQMQKILGPLRAAVHVFVTDRTNLVRCLEFPKQERRANRPETTHDLVRSPDLVRVMGTSHEPFMSGTTARA